MFAQQALTLSRSIHSVRDEVASLINLGEVFLDDGDYPAAKDYFRNAALQSKAIGADQQRYEAVFRIGVCFYFQNSSDSALTYAIDALNYFEKNDLPQQEATIKSFLGFVYLRRSMYSDAYRYYQESLKLRMTEGNINEIAKSFNAIGTLLLKQESYPDALQYFQQSIDQSITIGNAKGLAISEAQMGYIYGLTGDFTQARKYLSSSLDRSRHTGIQKDIALCLQYFGDLYTQLDKYDSASYFYQQSDMIREKLRDDYARVELLTRRANSANHFHDFQVSLRIIDQALLLSATLESPELEKLIYATQADSYLGLGDSKRFMEAYRKNLAIEDTLKVQKLILNTYTFRQELLEARRIIERREAQYREEAQRGKSQLLFMIMFGMGIILAFSVVMYVNQLHANQKIQKQNQVIQATVSDLEKANEQLLTLNQELKRSEEKLLNVNNTKDRFFSILGHDLRGPLASLSMYLDEFVLGSDTNDSFHLRAGAQLRTSVGSLIDLLNNLLLWAQNQAKGIEFRPRTHDLNELVLECAPLLHQLAQVKNIELRFSHAREVLDVEGDKDMLTLIIRNLAGNSIKFTPLSGTVTVTTSRAEDYVTIEVLDTGIGMNADQLAHLFDLDKRKTRRGTGEERGAGLGLILVNDFVQKHEGVLAVSSTPSVGSVFTVKFKASPKSLA